MKPRFISLSSPRILWVLAGLVLVVLGYAILYEPHYQLHRAIQKANMAAWPVIAPP